MSVQPAHETSAMVVERPHCLVRCGAELVELSERFYRRIFLCALGIVAIASVAALALLPLRQSAPDGGPATPAVVAAALLLSGVLATIWTGRPAYRLARGHESVQLGIVLIAAVLVAAIPPLQSELWAPACALLGVVATLTRFQRAIGYCLVVLVANLASHLYVGDLAETPVVAVIGLWVGLPFWTAIVSATTSVFAGQLLRSNATETRTPLPPRRVRAWTDDPEDYGAPEEPGEALQASHPKPVHRTADPEPEDPPLPSISAERVIDRLTNRQLQVVALLADGLLYGEIAACLLISVGQVQRHAGNAVRRAGVSNVRKLVASAIAEGLVGDPARFAQRGTGPDEPDATRPW